ERERHGERRALARRARERDRAAHGVDDLLRDPEPEPEAAVVARGDGALEAAEEAGLVLRRDPDAVVPDDEARGPLDAVELDLDRLAAAVLRGVADEVREHLRETDPVPAPDERPLGRAQ